MTRLTSGNLGELFAYEATKGCGVGSGLRPPREGGGAYVHRDSGVGGWMLNTRQRVTLVIGPWGSTGTGHRFQSYGNPSLLVALFASLT